MQPDPQDRSIVSSKPGGPPIGLILAAVVIIAAIAYFWIGRDEPAPAPDAATPPTVVTPASVPVAELPPAPDIPEPQALPEPEPAEPESLVPAVPPPTLEASDGELRLRLGEATDSPLVATTAGKDHLVDRLAGAVNSMSQGVLAYKALPLPPPGGKFAVAPAGGTLLLDPLTYKRYDPYAQMIENLDTETLVATFHRFRPLLEDAYAELGNRAEDFDNALVRLLDHILATPPLEGTVVLVKDEAVYKYADPELERRSDLQKQLMRTGPENLARVQAQAQRLREALLPGT